VEPRSVLSRARFSVPLCSSVRLLQRGDRFVAPSRKSSWNIPQRQGPTGPGRAQSEFGVATCQGFFAVVTRLKVEFAAEAALFEFSSGFGRSHLVSRRSSGNPIKDSLSGIVWFLHGFVLQPREARGLQVRRSPAAPRRDAGKPAPWHAGLSWRSPGRKGTLGFDVGRLDPIAFYPVDPPVILRACLAVTRVKEGAGHGVLLCRKGGSTSHPSVGNSGILGRR
jgi:hypothetical protein